MSATRSVRAERFAHLARIAKSRERFTFSVVAPETFAGLLREIMVAIGERVRAR